MREPTTAAEVLARARATQQRLNAQRLPSPQHEAIQAPLEPPPPEPAPPPLSEWEARWRLVLDLVSERYRVAAVPLLGPQRHGTIVRPRSIAMYLLREVVSMSLTAIGRRMNRDHTSVLDGLLRVTKRMRQEEAFAMEVAELEQECLARCTQGAIKMTPQPSRMSAMNKVDSAVLAALSDQWQSVADITKKAPGCDRNNIRHALLRLVESGVAERDQRMPSPRRIIWVYRRHKKPGASRNAD